LLSMPALVCCPSFLTLSIEIWASPNLGRVVNLKPCVCAAFVASRKLGGSCCRPILMRPAQWALLSAFTKKVLLAAGSFLFTRMDLLEQIR
jgi:hypothetical protein